MQQVDVLIIGAGAAGMMCAIEAGRRGRNVLIVDHGKAAGEKIRISGGGRCNFTNLYCDGKAFLSANPKFALSALNRYTQWDFIELIAQHGIAYHEKTLGQLFCDGSATQIVKMLLDLMAEAGVTLQLGASVSDISRGESGYSARVDGQKIHASSIVVATGGKSIPKMGATGFGYQIAEQFGLPLEEIRPGLVPLMFAAENLERMKALSGLAVPAAVSSGVGRFEEGLLFTHRGLSGPSILQISSYWRDGEEIVVDLLPGNTAFDVLKAAQKSNGRQGLAAALAAVLPKRLAATIAEEFPTQNIADFPDVALRDVAERVNQWRLKPAGSEGYRTAEVTLGGVSTDALNAKTMEARDVPGLYFIGEVVDVTGWLGGYNFQWAWSSGWAAGQVV